ncbi:PQQ-dependent sugar dehydrogenase [Hymenobacter actinosclerus]|uniref:Dehydrogenase, PQQ-dependent, s-GDH family n=1 Tax=Hymenobacter actinosclerus TaxID=82805 RepID=A0A1H9ZWB0_9BACT|nr:PQQ-dependent sugar dehydrogenase [Hymenobacter actinosclerus]SES85157.1 dehydrogenase, PQQ-dependent, s-GDH family [Hymenobacter actinosclerus]
MKHLNSFLTTLLLAATTPLAAQTPLPVLTTFPVGATTVTVSALTTGLTVPWELVWGPDNFIWMTERGGRISRVNPTTGAVTPLITLSDVATSSEGGLLGLALHPDFAVSPYVYVVYNYTDAGGTYLEKLVRLTYANGALGAPLTLLGNIPATSTHSGSRLLMLPDRTLLMSTGDAQQQPQAQNPASLNGKILRLNLDGSIPANNPTPGSRVYTLGHRNPQGLVQSPAGRLYSSEHGPDSDDELNLIEPGRNYGWPTVEGYCNRPEEQTFCAANNVKEPLTTWTPTLGVAGLTYYSSPAIPGWQNHLLLVSLKGARLTDLALNATGDAIPTRTDYLSGFGRLRAICVSPQGRVYVATSNRDGRGSPAPTDDRILVLENRDFVVTSTATPAAARLQLWPNPARHTLTLERPALGEDAITISDALGRRVQTARFAAGQKQVVFSVEGLKPGVYLVQNGSRAQRLVVEE